MATTYYFLKSLDGRYLQAQLDASTGEYAFWLNAKRAWSPCCTSVQAAEQYKAAAAATVGELVIAAEAL